MARVGDEDDPILDALTDVWRRRDALDVTRYWFCAGPPRCPGTRREACQFCFRFYDDDKRTPEEIAALMRYRQ